MILRPSMLSTKEWIEHIPSSQIGYLCDFPAIYGIYATEELYLIFTKCTADQLKSLVEKSELSRNYIVRLYAGTMKGA